MTTRDRPAPRLGDPGRDRDDLDAAQVDGLLDMDPETFRAAAHQVVDVMADYLASIERRAVFPNVEPGAIQPLFSPTAPDFGEPIGAILDDYRRLVEPNATAWQHPGFLAYFATTASGPGILGEMLTAAIGQNAMLWRTSPIATELEAVVVGWLREAFGLPGTFDGVLTDTASISSLIALASAREAAGIDAAAKGIGGRPDVPRLRVYASAEAHSSIEKACMTLGLGRESFVRIPTDAEYRLRPELLAEAVSADRAAGLLPIAVVATLGTTSSTSVDPIDAIADVTERERLWLHADAAYGGAAAIAPELRGLFRGWARADSIVVNPHKWLFTPLDASLYLTRRLDAARAAFSLSPEYLRTLDRSAPTRDFNDVAPQLGRRFRALKLWLLIRWFGLEGLRRRIRRHVELAGAFASTIDAAPEWERLAPVPFATVCFRHVPGALAADEDALERHNAAVMESVNRTGEVFLSHTKLGGRFAVRVSIGNIRTEARHVERAWELLNEAVAEVGR
ncbi:MAG: pyridoxal phosphate-dependent decarboxylase family protein [Chloroflexota bacterium]